MADLNSDLWAVIAEYTNNGTLLLAVDPSSRLAAERFCPDESLAVQREMFMSAGAKPSTSVSYYYDDSDGWEEIMLFKRTDMELLYRMFWWFHRSEIAVHVPIGGEWVKKAKSLGAITEREGSLKTDRTNHYVTWSMIEGFRKTSYGALRLLFTDEVIDEENYVKQFRAKHKLDEVDPPAAA